MPATIGDILKTKPELITITPEATHESTSEQYGTFTGALPSEPGSDCICRSIRPRTFYLAKVSSPKLHRFSW